MSYEAIGWAMSRPGLSDIEKLTLIYLGNYAEMDGWWRGRLDQVAADMERPVEALQAALAALASRGVVRLKGGHVYLQGGDVLAGRF